MIKKGALPTDKGSPHALLADLAFAFFGHQKEFQSVKGDIERIIDLYSERVISLLNFFHSQIQQENYDKSHYSFLDNQYLSDYFLGKKFHHIKKSLIDKKVDFKGKKNKIQRGVFFAILTIARDMFQWEVNHPIILEARVIVEYKEQDFNVLDVSRQIKTLNQILAVIQDFTNKNPPDWSVTFTDMPYRPIIKTDRTGSFLNVSDARREAEHLAGRFTIYRKLFLPEDNNRIYTREALTIRFKNFGITFEYKTRNAAKNDISKFQGVGILLDGSFWLIGHTRDLYSRMRIMAGSSHDWYKLQQDQSTISYAELGIQGHVKDDQRVMVSHCRAICKIQEKNSASSPFFDNAEFLNIKELRKYLTEEEISLLC